MHPRSGLFEAGGILLLVGAIMASLGALLLLLLSIGFGAFSAALGAPGEATIVFALYGVLGLVSAAGAVFGFVGFARARRGDAHGAWVMGLVSSLLPPVQALSLTGAILCKVSPECKAQETGSTTLQAPATWQR